jgi:RNA polymerase sigma-70 factor (ECF subfamily)
VRVCLFRHFGAISKLVYCSHYQSSKFRPIQGAILDSPRSATPPLDDQHAVERALDGDLEAFNQLVVEYQRLAYSVAYRVLQDQDAAADAVQESFIKAYRALNSFRGGSFKSWLLRIVVNSCYDMLRSRKRRDTDSIDDDALDQDYASHMVDATEGPHAYAERMELSRHIEQGIAQLPPDQRLVLTLCDIHGYAYEEISEITGVPMGTVKSRISRGRGKLRDYLLENPELLPSTLRPKHE